MTDRDGNAPSLAGVLSDTIVNQGPEKIVVSRPKVTAEMVAGAASAPLTQFQEALLIGSSILPAKNIFVAFIEALKKELFHPQPPTARSGEEALPYILKKVSTFLGRSDSKE